MMLWCFGALVPSPPPRAGGLSTSDRIVEVDGVKLDSADHEKAVAAIQGAPGDIVFMVQSLHNWVSAADSCVLLRLCNIY
jgi:hypothetical protein